MSGKIKCLVVDDEPLARELIETHIQQIDTLQHIVSCDSAMKAFQIISRQKIDLMFLDIQMPLLTGLEFLKSLKNPPKVILTTAFRDYALDGYELDVIDYLLKPITFQRFFRAIEKYYQVAAPVAHEPEKSLAAPFIYLKVNKKNFKVYIGDILYIESLKDYSHVYTLNRKITVKQPISEIENSLPGAAFLRIHRSYLINLEKMTAFTATSVEVNGKELPIGASYKTAVFKVLH